MFGIITELRLSTEPAASRLDSPRLGAAFWGCVALVFAIPILVVSYEAAMHFDGVAIDGPFQLYDALRRIQAGFRPGVEFQFFHGMGIPYLHYWLYRLLGGGLHGSEMARQMIDAVAYPAVFLVFFRAFTASWRRTLCMTAAALALSLLLHLTAVVFASNGMVGVRSAAATLVPVVLWRNAGRWRRFIATGVALGVAMLLSTEQGLAALLAYVVVSAFAVIRRRGHREQLVESAATILLAIVTLAAGLLAIGGIAGMRGALRYNFSIVPKNQFWYFGAPPNTFLPSWGVGLRMIVGAAPIGLALVLALAASAFRLYEFWRTPDDDAGRRNFALAMLPLYGLISCGSLLGVFTVAYVQPCWRAILILALLEGAELADRRDVHAGRSGWAGVPRGLAVACGAAAILTVTTVSLVAVSFETAVVHIPEQHIARHQGFAASGIWPRTLVEAQRIIDAHRGADGKPPVLWSTYAGWIEARNGMFNPSFDYIIHALGPANRRRYVDTFRTSRPALVQTVLPSYGQYEPWIENNNWPFYDELLRWYTVAGTTPWSVFWQRRKTPEADPQLVATIAIPPGARAVQLPRIPSAGSTPNSTSNSTSMMLLDVSLDYETRNPLHWLPLVGESPRYLIGVQGAYSNVPISLDPYVRHTSFPLFVGPGQQPVLRFQTFSLIPGAAVQATSLRISVRPMDPADEIWMRAMFTRLTKGTR